jgi:hypothetical protein
MRGGEREKEEEATRPVFYVEYSVSIFISNGTTSVEISNILYIYIYIYILYITHRETRSNSNSFQRYLVGR